MFSITNVERGDEPHICRFHAVTVYDKGKRDICVEIRDNAVLCGEQDIGIEGNDEKIDQPAEDSTQSVDGRIFTELDYFSLHDEIYLLKSCKNSLGARVGFPVFALRKPWTVRPSAIHSCLFSLRMR